MGLAAKIKSDAGMSGMGGMQQPGVMGMPQPGMGMQPGMSMQQPGSMYPTPSKPGMQQPLGSAPMTQQQYPPSYPPQQSQYPPSYPPQQPGMGMNHQPSAPLQPGMQNQTRPGMSQSPYPQPGMTQQSTYPPSYPPSYPPQQGMGMQQQPGMSQPLRVDQYMPNQGSYQQGRMMPPVPGYGGGGDVNMLTNKIQANIQENQLQNFYPPQRMQQVIQRLQNVDFGALAMRWKISKELAYDLAPLALYDIVFFCDDSGSMEFEENGERIDDLKVILSKVAEVVTLFDDDGISVRFMNNSISGDGIRTEQEALRLLNQIRFGGITPIGTQLDRKIIQPYTSNMQKPIMCVIITDGEPSGESTDTLRQVIQKAKNNLSHTQYGPGAINFQIAQVGKDQKAQQFLASLDNDPVIGHMIDCTSYYEYEAMEMQRKGVNLTPELWLLKLCVGAIDRSYDEQDE